jgi:hypothetical protein
MNTIPLTKAIHLGRHRGIHAEKTKPGKPNGTKPRYHRPTRVSNLEIPQSSTRSTSGSTINRSRGAASSSWCIESTATPCSFWCWRSTFSSNVVRWLVERVCVIIVVTRPCFLAVIFCTQEKYPILQCGRLVE